MKKIIFLFLFTLSFALSANARTVSLVDYGAVAGDLISDDAAMTAAVNDLKQSGGGTIVFPEGKVILAAQQNFAQYGKYVNFRLQGTKNSVIEVAGTYVLFNFGNTPQVEIEGLTFVGRNVPSHHPHFSDAWLAVIYSPSAHQVTIRNTQFFGLRSRDSIVKAVNGDLRIENVQFEGNSTLIANVHATGTSQRGLTVKNTIFLDYTNWQELYLSKTPEGNGSWIRVDGGVTPTSATGQRPVRIEDCRFDEGANTGIYIADAFGAELSGLTFNVSGISGGNGITLSNVEFADIRSSWFGYTPYQRPAIIALKNSTVRATAIKMGGGVYFGNVDASSRIHTEFCNNCQPRQMQ